MKRIVLVGAFLVVDAGVAACDDDDARDVLTVQVDGSTMSVSGDPSSGAVDVEISGDRERAPRSTSPGCRTTSAVVCFMQDRAGGPPDAFAHDMYDAFTVT